MTGDELTPERLDAILDGREPAIDDEARDVLALAAALREAAPGAGAALRARVHALPQPEPRGRMRRLLARGWRGRLLVAAPALSAVIVAVVAIAVLGQSSDPERIALEQREATTQPGNTAGDAAPPASAPSTAAKAADTGAALATAPLVVRVEEETLAARLADIRRLVEDAGGTVESSPASPGPAALLAITVPGARSADLLDAIVSLGVAPQTDALPADADQRRSGAARVRDADAHVDVLLTEAP